MFVKVTIGDEAGVGGSPTSSVRTITYTYDGLNRLIGAAESPGTSYAYAYDLAGNRTGVWENGIPTQAYSYNAANQVVGWSYDAAGNLLSDGATSSTWDALNRTLTRAGASYAYNGDGILVAQTIGGVTTRYAQDLALPLPVILSDGAAQYVYGHERLVGAQGGQATWYVPDALGSVRLTLDGAGVPLGSASYDPWGTAETAAIAPFGFTGELQAPDGLTYLRARWYQPQAAMFTSRDPFSGWSEQPDSLHPYAYVGNNPVNRFDPTGKWWWGPGQALFDNSTQRFQNQNIHVRIQAFAMTGLEQQIHAEYAGAGLSIDLLDSVSGEIWEIKPWDDAATGSVEMWARIDAMTAARAAGQLSGIDPRGLPYDWNEHPMRWNPGRTFPPGEHYLGVATDGAWMWDIYAAQTEPGLILWWKHNRRRGVQVPYPILLPSEQFWSRRNTRPGWQPQPAPAYAQPISRDMLATGAYCVAVVVAIGVTVAIVANPVPGDEVLLPAIWVPLVGPR